MKAKMAKKAEMRKETVKKVVGAVKKVVTSPGRAMMMKAAKRKMR